MTSTPTLRIGHGNGHNEQSLVDYVREAKADSFACLESQRLASELRNIANSRLTVAGEGVRDARSRSTALVTSNDREYLGELVRKASEEIPAFERVAPDRMVVASFYAHPIARELGKEGVAHFALHPDAGPEALSGNNPAHPIAREYSEALQTAAKWMKVARQDGLLLVLTGDLQVPRTNTKPWGPNELLVEPLDLEVWSAGIDWVCYDKLLSLKQVKTKELFDHKGFVATFTA